MTLIYSVIICLFFMSRSCQLQCVKEPPNDTEFSINVTTHIKAESGDCIEIPYEFTFSTNKVTVPYRVIWFKGDPQNTINTRVVTNIEYATKDLFLIHGLPRGEYQYGLKLEWECNQTYIFPKRVHISVSALNKRPAIWAYPMTEGQYDTLECKADRLCFKILNVYWEWTKADGQSSVLRGDIARGRGHFGRHPGRDYRRQRTILLRVIPKADDHNTSITCVADYGDVVAKTSVILIVKFPPRIVNGSLCMVEGKRLVCVCVSRGNPLPPITWPSVSLTDFSVSSSSRTQTVNSTITMSAADYHNTSVTCISSNELGRTEVEIPIQNYTGNSRLQYQSDSNPKSDTVLLLIITGLSSILNLVLIAIVIICTRKWGKSQQKEPGEEMNTYSSLNQADVEQPYSVISPQAK